MGLLDDIRTGSKTDEQMSQVYDMLGLFGDYVIDLSKEEAQAFISESAMDRLMRKYTTEVTRFMDECGEFDDINDKQTKKDMIEKAVKENAKFSVEKDEDAELFMTVHGKASEARVKINIRNIDNDIAEKMKPAIKRHNIEVADFLATYKSGQHAKSGEIPPYEERKRQELRIEKRLNEKVDADLSKSVNVKEYDDNKAVHKDAVLSAVIKNIADEGVIFDFDTAMELLPKEVFEDILSDHYLNAFQSMPYDVLTDNGRGVYNLRIRAFINDTPIMIKNDNDRFYVTSLPDAKVEFQYPVYKENISKERFYDKALGAIEGHLDEKSYDGKLTEKDATLVSLYHALGGKIDFNITSVEKIENNIEQSGILQKFRNQEMPEIENNNQNIGEDR
jgi:hypothetical protein